MSGKLGEIGGNKRVQWYYFVVVQYKMIYFIEFPRKHSQTLKKNPSENGLHLIWMADEL